MENLATSPTTAQRLGAEALGTFWLVLGGCGTAVLAGDQVGYVGVALAFGLTVVTGAYAFGPVSGGHFNPTVTVGLAVARRFDWKDVPGYAAVQVVGASIAGAVTTSSRVAPTASPPRARSRRTATATAPPVATTSRRSWSRRPC